MINVAILVGIIVTLSVFFEKVNTEDPFDLMDNCYDSCKQYLTDQPDVESVDSTSIGHPFGKCMAECAGTIPAQ